MKRKNVGAAIAVCVVLGFGGTVAAGEYDGKGNPVPGGEKGKSECSYSGRDIPDGVGPGFENNPFPFMDDDAITQTRGKAMVQSYGRYVSAGLKQVVPSPGELCRGNLGH
jgi:hypothetical protein